MCRKGALARIGLPVVALGCAVGIETTSFADPPTTEGSRRDAVVLGRNGQRLVDPGDFPSGAGDSSENCLWDCDNNNVIEVIDLLDLLAGWGPCLGCCQDFDGNNIVNVVDLLKLLANWGPCPVTITDVSPLFGAEGDLITIIGEGFDPNPMNSCVLVGGRGGSARVVSASETVLVAQIRAVAQVQSGDVEVLSGIGNILPPEFVITGDGTVTEWLQPVLLEDVVPTAADVDFQLTAPSSDTDAFTFEAGMLVATVSGDLPALGTVVVDLHAFLGVREGGNFAGNGGEGFGQGLSFQSLTAAQVADHVRTFLNQTYGDFGFSAGGSGATVTVSHVDGIVNGNGFISRDPPP